MTTAPGVHALARVSPEFLIWGITAVIAAFVAPANLTLAVATLGTASVALGVRAFWSHGGRYITATGVFMMAFSIFVGVAALSLITDSKYVIDGWVWRALLVTFIAQVIVCSVTAARPLPQFGDIGPVNRQVTAWGVSTGLILMLLGLAGSAAGLGNPLVDASAFVGIVLLAAALWRHPGGGIGMFRMAVAGVGFLVYVTQVFDGFGRLTVATLGFALAIAASHRWKGRRLKAAIISLSIPALLIASASRVEFGATLNPNQSSGVTGFESGVTPLLALGELLRRTSDGVLDLAWGSTFAVSAVTFVPRELWENKPIGFGAELAYLLRPEIAPYGHSELALLAGEFVYNFGLIGVLVMVPLTVMVLGASDRFILMRITSPIERRSQLLALAAAAILAAGVLDLFWGGTFTFMSRGGTRLLVLFIVFALLAIRRPKDAAPAPEQRKLPHRRLESSKVLSRNSVG